ncbi:hypothetical protein U1Q18_043081, partial [Sarracenia purpurea var. burkii]
EETAISIEEKQWWAVLPFTTSTMAISKLTENHFEPTPLKWRKSIERKRRVKKMPKKVTKEPPKYLSILKEHVKGQVGRQSAIMTLERFRFTCRWTDINKKTPKHQGAAWVSNVVLSQSLQLPRKAIICTTF